MACRFFCTLLCNAKGDGCAPTTPALPPPGIEGSKVEESCRERSDLEGRVDWENGVVGDVMLADVLATPFAPVENDVVS